MTRNEWLNATDPQTMIRYLIGTDAPRVQDVEAFPDCRTSARKLRLFACACFHRIRHLLRSQSAQKAIVVAERFADGETSEWDLQLVDDALLAEAEAMEDRWRASRGEKRTALFPIHAALAQALQATHALAPIAAYYSSSNAYLNASAILNPGEASLSSGFHAARNTEEQAQTHILRCLFGDPFRPVTVHPSWLTRPVPSLALAAYEERHPDQTLDPDRLVILADAVEEAGCTDGPLLTHLRSPGPHYRGCLALDLLLGKQ